MRVVYVAFSKIKSPSRGNQIQCSRTYEALCKLNSDTFGIFLGDEGTGVSKEGNAFYINLKTNTFTWLEKIFKIAIVRKILFPYLFIKKAFKILRTIEPIDLAYVRIFGISDAIYLIKRIHKFKIRRLVFELHDLDYDISIYHHNFEIAIRKAQHKKLFKELTGLYPEISLATVTFSLAEAIKKDFNFTQPISAISNGHDFENKSPKIIDYKKKWFNITYAGLNFFKIKGIDCLIKSLIFLDERFSVTLIGGNDRHRKAFESKFKDLVDSKKLEILPPTGHEEVSKKLYSSDFGILPLPAGRFSSFTSPLKMFEYMAIGLPIISSDVPAIREVLSNGVNAIFFKPDDPVDLAEKIMYLVNNQEIARRIGQNAFMDSKKFTYEKRAQKIIDCFNL